MKKILLLVFVASVSICASAQELKTEADTISYAAGMTGANGLAQYLEQQFGITKEEIPQFVEAFKEYMKKKDERQTIIQTAGYNIAQQIDKGMMPQMKDQYGKDFNEELALAGFLANVLEDTTHMAPTAAREKVKAKMEEIKKIKEAEKAKRDEATKAEGLEFLKKNASKKDVKVLPSGLQYKVLTEGKGEIPTKDQTVTVKYEGRLINGTVFDSSYERNPQTTDFKPTQVIKGWTEALTMMPVGSVWELYIPQDLAYGSRDTGKIPAYSTLIFKVELISVKDTPEPAKKPAAQPRRAAAKSQKSQAELEAEVAKAVADAKAKIAAKEKQEGKK